MTYLAIFILLVLAFIGGVFVGKLFGHLFFFEDGSKK